MHTTTTSIHHKVTHSKFRCFAGEQLTAEMAGAAAQEQCGVDAATHGSGRPRRVLMFPLPYQGHITPMLHLAEVLHGRGLAITVLHTNLFNALDPARHPHFTFVAVPDGVPADVAAYGNGTEVIQAVNDAMEADDSAALRGVLEPVLADPGQPPVACIIFDANLFAVPTAATALRLPAMALHTASAACLGCILDYPVLHEKGYLPPQESKLYMPVKELPPLRVKDLFYLPVGNHEVLQKLFARVIEATRKSAGVVINTFDLLESAELEKIRGQLNIPAVHAVGPVHKLSSSKITGSSALENDYSCIEWLDLRPSRSVLYVSFGSLASIDSNDFLEVAWGLANSGHPFLWVIRPGMVQGLNGLGDLPDGFEDEIQGRGKVIQWAPQQAVLAHPAVAGFWTHCGWNSTLESISEGIPMICRPQFADQMMNTRYVEKRWGVGFELEGKLERGKIEMAIRKLFTGREGYEVREKALGLKKKVAECSKPGGSSHLAVDKLVKYIHSL